MNFRRSVAFLVSIAAIAISMILASHRPLLAQQETPRSQQTLTIEEYDPKSTLVVPEHKIDRAKFPFIDIHSHHWNPTPSDVDELIKGMDSINLQVMVNLSGGTGDRLKRTVEVMKGRYPNRFVVFANMDYGDLDQPGFSERVTQRLEQDVKNGAQGLKIFKDFGMELHYKSGERVHVDDPAFSPVFEKCADLGIPVLIHVAEPSAFFDPWDKYNERWLELKQFPQRARPRGCLPSRSSPRGRRTHRGVS